MQHDSSAGYPGEGGGGYSRGQRVRRTLTYEILNVFVKKLINPGLYQNYELTLKQFDSSLDFFERKISKSLYKVTDEISLDEAKVPQEVLEKMRLQYEYCVDGGELFLDAIDEMKFYIDHVDENGDNEHMNECDWEGEEHLEEGLEIALEADEKISKSLLIYDELYEEDY